MEEYRFDYEDNQQERPVKRPKKKTRTLTKLGVVVVSAAVIGLIGGTAFYGVNYMGSMVAKSAEQAAAAETENHSLAAGEENAIDTTAVLKDTPMVQETDNTAGTVSDVAEKCMPSLVTIGVVSLQEMQSYFGGTQTYEAQGAGSGVIVGQNDTELLIATNDHVINGATSVSVGFADESSASATVKGTDHKNDLAIVAVNLSEISQETLDQIRIAQIGDSDQLVLGEQVVAIGNALGYGQSVTSGYISAFDRTITLSDGTETFESSGLIMFDAAINAGNSGGALFNMNGELIGINEAKSSSASLTEASVEAMSYAIPVAKAYPILEKLMTMEPRVKSENAGYLGVTCANVSEDIAETYSIPTGVCLTGVAENGPAASAGLMKGDVIVGVNDMEISSYEELAEEISYHSVGETVQIRFMRANNGEYAEGAVSVTLGDSSALSQWNSQAGQQGNSQYPEQQGNEQYPGQQGNGQYPGQQGNEQYPGQQGNSQYPGQQGNSQYPGQQGNNSGSNIFGFGW